MLTAPHSSLVHNSNSLALIGLFSAVFFLPSLLALVNAPVGTVFYCICINLYFIVFPIIS